jgi:glycine/D-amino acid oxidase-like deaminating enzyme
MWSLGATAMSPCGKRVSRLTEKSVAIIGAGFAGLALCSYLQGDFQCTLYDPAGIGGGASAISAGLVHAFTGPEARVSSIGRAAFAASQRLIEQVPDAIASSGILRVALTERQQTCFHERSAQYPGLRWMSANETSTLVPGLVAAPGLWIADGLVIHPQRYLHGLWALCENHGAVLRREAIQDLSQLKAYDAIVVASGLGSGKFAELAHLLLRGLKGQIIELAWSTDLPPLPVALNSDVYVIPAREGASCVIGATFEREFSDAGVDRAVAEAYLRPKAEALIPALKGARLLDCRAGIRATMPNHQPIAQHIEGRIWALTGLGSKGLLYHAYLAEKLSREIITVLSRPFGTP